MLLALPLVILGAAFAVQAHLAHDAGVLRVARHHSRISVPRAPLDPSPKLHRRKSCLARKTTTKTAAAAKATALNEAAVAGIIKVVDSRCGPSGATTKITKTAGPNGDIDWLNCGLTGEGWSPPRIDIQEVKAIDLNDALKSSSSPFHACSKFVPFFYKYGGENGIPPIMLASFAMQESTCNPETVGGGGEQGLMQLTKDKCGGAPNNNCKDPEFNIKKGAAFFAKTLSDNNGDLLLSIGEYNGWYKGLTRAKATAARYTSCCRCQNNMDYLHQHLNGWMQNTNPYTMGLGKYFNLDVCGN
ncbi:lysozyme-like protein [Mycena pura]|uniref:Lysozyme-like protein n=1 Tax=Mycena pura TaxID=153505 RepID=A0AAD6YFW8_9AGAR|nr:lysozyme-like protein [Mycena pura]